MSSTYLFPVLPKTAGFLTKLRSTDSTGEVCSVAIKVYSYAR